MLDAGATTAVAAPCAVADDPVIAKSGRDELPDATIAAIGENTTVMATEGLDHRAAVVSERARMRTNLSNYGVESSPPLRDSS